VVAVGVGVSGFCQRLSGIGSQGGTIHSRDGVSARLDDLSGVEFLNCNDEDVPLPPADPSHEGCDVDFGPDQSGPEIPDAVQCEQHAAEPNPGGHPEPCCTPSQRRPHRSECPGNGN
jgi:hypothetical protein